MKQDNILQKAVETVELAWIPVTGNRKLAARLFLPRDAVQNSVPCILEYLPYRRRDGTRGRDDTKHIWFAANGYASARVDIAGTGDSEGLVEDEYVKREQDDALEIIAWLSKQPWCSGNVGMIGISWGGFNGLQIAARRPPQLKAIVTSCSTDDRYACDAHYLGGCLINDNFSWGGAFFTYGGLPPDPAMVGEDRWRAMWKERIANLRLFPAEWLKHQRRDAFWKHGSVCEDYDAIECAVLAVGGWLDGYTPTIISLVENLKAPCKGLIGPWGHKEPNQGVPAPAIDFLNECKRWWDRWLKGIETGVEKDPDIRLYVMDYAKPVPHFLERKGRWLGFKDWPSRKIKNKAMYLSSASLIERKPRARPARLSICSPQTVGMKGQEWCPYGQGRVAAEGATDQREDDGGSLCFDTAPLKAPLHLVGNSFARLRIAADKPQALVAVRLTDVAPDGTSALITFGILNLAHRDSHEFPGALKPGKFYNVSVPFKSIAQTVPKGHRLRLAVSSTYWPMAWPSPEGVTLTIDVARSKADLAVLPSLAGLGGVKFGPAQSAPDAPMTETIPDKETRSVHYAVETQTTTFDIKSDDGQYTLDEIGTEQTSTRTKTYSVQREDPTTCRTLVGCTQSYKRGDWDARVETEVAVSCDKTHFHVTGWLKAYDHGELFATREYKEKIKRDCM
jgi:putative CocE/NonD family hydrolase